MPLRPSAPRQRTAAAPQPRWGRPPPAPRGRPARSCRARERLRPSPARSRFPPRRGAGLPGGTRLRRFSTADSARPAARSRRPRPGAPPVPPAPPRAPRLLPLPPWGGGAGQPAGTGVLGTPSPLAPARARRAPPSPPPGCFLVPSSPSGAESSLAAVSLLTVLDRDAGGGRGMLPPKRGGDLITPLHVRLGAPRAGRADSPMLQGAGPCPHLVVPRIAGRETILQLAAPLALPSPLPAPRKAPGSPLPRARNRLRSGPPAQLWG